MARRRNNRETNQASEILEAAVTHAVQLEINGRRLDMGIDVGDRFEADSPVVRQNPDFFLPVPQVRAA